MGQISDSAVTNPCDTIYVDNFVYETDTIFQTEYVTNRNVVNRIYYGHYSRNRVCRCNRIYYGHYSRNRVCRCNRVCDSTIVEIVESKITDTIVEIEFIDVIITEYIDCETGLPCASGIEDLIDKSKTNNKIYNLSGQEIQEREYI